MVGSGDVPATENNAARHAPGQVQTFALYYRRMGIYPDVLERSKRTLLYIRPAPPVNQLMPFCNQDVTLHDHRVR